VKGYSVEQVGSSTTTYSTLLARYEGYKELKLSATSTQYTTDTYDLNGNLQSISDSTLAANNRSFVNDTQGMALYVNQGVNAQRQVIVGAEVLGRYGVQVDPVNPKQGNGNPNFAQVADFNSGTRRSRDATRRHSWHLRRAERGHAQGHCALGVRRFAAVVSGRAGQRAGLRCGPARGADAQHPNVVAPSATTRAPSSRTTRARSSATPRPTWRPRHRQQRRLRHAGDHHHGGGGGGGDDLIRRGLLPRRWMSRWQNSPPPASAWLLRPGRWAMSQPARGQRDRSAPRVQLVRGGAGRGEPGHHARHRTGTITGLQAAAAAAGRQRPSAQPSPAP